VQGLRAERGGAGARLRLAEGLEVPPHPLARAREARRAREALSDALEQGLGAREVQLGRARGRQPAVAGATGGQAGRVGAGGGRHTSSSVSSARRKCPTRATCGGAGGGGG
jgi:hypothetical protein